MVDKENVRSMSRMAMLEAEEHREITRISRYQRVEYAVVQAVKGFVAGTVCFAAGLGLWVCYIWDDVNTYFYDAQYMEFFRQVLGWYCMFMFIYLVICAVVALYRHKRFREKKYEYLRYLRALKRSYLRQDGYRRRESDTDGDR